MLEKSYLSPRTLTYTLLFGLFLKLKKYGGPIKPSELFCFKEKNFAALLFSLAACDKRFQRANATDIAKNGHDPPDDWLKTGRARDSQTRTRLVDSLICIRCLLENNAFSVLHYVVVALHYSMLHRFCPWNNRARLYQAVASQPRVFARLLFGN